MTTTFTHPVQKHEVQRILASAYDRALFVQEYRYFGRDSNDKLYKTFILDALKNGNNADLISDVIYMAIEIDFFSKPLQSEIEKILFSRRHYLIKLSCLDYLTHFKNKITNKDFYTCN